MALLFAYYIILASDWSIVRSQYTLSEIDVTTDGKRDGGDSSATWTLDETSRRVTTDFTAALTP